MSVSNSAAWLLLPRLACGQNKTPTTSRLTFQPLSKPQHNSMKYDSYLAQRSFMPQPYRFPSWSSHIHNPSICIFFSAVISLPRSLTHLPLVSEDMASVSMSEGLASGTLGSGFDVQLASSCALRWSSQLRCYGTGEDDNWGFRIYRTIYTPESDRGWRILT